MIGNRKNYDDVFFRDLTVCFLATLEDKIKWHNRFDTVTKEITVPIYYSMGGNTERMLYDSFTDDIVSENRRSELNTDIIPRGHATLTSYSVKSAEFCNPNVWLHRIMESEEEAKRVLTKVRAIPVKATYELTILLESEIDTFKCSQAIMNTLWLYKYMYFEYSSMNIDAYMQMPDDQTIQISRENNLSSDTSIRMTVNIEVHTYYPAYDEKQIMLPPTGVLWNLRKHFAGPQTPEDEYNIGLTLSLTASNT